MKTFLNKQQLVDNFIVCSLGGIHLKGSEYLSYILFNYNDGKFKIKDVATHFNINEGILERNLRYYFQYILTNNSDYFIKNTLKITPDMKLTNKNIIKHLCKVLYNDETYDYKVIRFNEDDWIATKVNIEETLDWYCEEFGFDKEDYMFEEKIYFTECDIDNEGMWMSPISKYEENKLGDHISISQNKEKLTFGDLMWHDCEKFKFISYREAIRRNNETDDCYVIATIHF